MNRTEVTSSQIKSIGYDPETQTLEIEFVQRDPKKLPNIYQYSQVPADFYGEFMAAESKGRFFGQRLRHEAIKYPYKKVQ